MLCLYYLNSIFYASILYHIQYHITLIYVNTVIIVLQMFSSFHLSCTKYIFYCETPWPSNSCVKGATQTTFIIIIIISMLKFK